MKRNFILTGLILVLLTLVFAGCGPKMANQTQLDQLQELRNAADASEAQVKECQDKIVSLQAEKEQLLKEIDALKNEIQIYK
ncbi:TPA: hypothetical protein DCW38_02035 [candidate division WOR-3 bacterium]|uniref:Uncharacterized protein n=1 Tax=candidate division WOR-3 bacterium TaxID=2052148 RepID=A0A350H8S7_UNCW3|nr:hypothetical protein [candidate division WOR-3 bacterium]